MGKGQVGPLFVALVLMAGPPGAAPGCSRGSTPVPQAEPPAPPATSTTAGAAPSSTAPPAASSAPPAPDDGGFGVYMRLREHMFLADYRSMLRTWMTPEEQARAARVDTARTDGGSAAKLALLEADRAVRVIAPLALDARGFHDEARALRGLAPIVDRRTADAAIAALEPIQQRTEPPGAAVEARPLGLEKPLVWSESALWQVKRGAAEPPPSGVIAAMAAGGAVRAGVARSAAVDAAIELLEAMAAAARAATR